MDGHVTIRRAVTTNTVECDMKVSREEKAVVGRMRKSGGIALTFLILSLGAISARAVEVVTENSNVTCEEYHLSRELKIYKDPTLFHSDLSPRDADDPLVSDSLVLTTVTGTIQMMRLGPPREFAGFGPIVKLHELAKLRLRARRKKAEPRLTKTSPVPDDISPLTIPVKICGGPNDPYLDTLGFVLVSDLRDAQAEEFEPGTLPPSAYPNPVPTLKGAGAPSLKADGRSDRRADE